MGSLNYNKMLQFILKNANVRKITQKKLIEGIYDYTHFNRMCNGKESIKIEILFLCAEKLGIPYKDLISNSMSDGEISFQKKYLDFQFYCLNQDYNSLSDLKNNIKNIKECSSLYS